MVQQMAEGGPHHSVREALSKHGARSVKLLVAMLLSGCAWGQELQVTGEEFAWKVETARYIIDLGRDPGTGRSGQINTIFVKEAGVLLTRARPTSTLHLSPNAAVTRQWAGINRWDPPRSHTVRFDALTFRLEREGQMPNVPELVVRTAYQFAYDSADVLVEESIEATADAAVALLRVCEWSLAPGAESIVSHIGWEDAGKAVVRRSEGEATLPFRTRWMGFYSEVKNVSFAATIDRMETGFVSGESARFGGDPHYFYRVLVAGEQGRRVTIPKGACYTVHYRVRAFRPKDPARPFQELLR
jgi:hypothetical protein